ncbi:MAG TPA: entericidin A/B family lipoprotein [Planctomycetota bacterium]|nr:entericidin A/B family lipoprotein [Planctomycetota bacterium]
MKTASLNASRRTRWELFAGAAVLLASLFAAACNTVEGAGEDIESVGEATSEASRDVRR